jgi:hypothetical protein
MEVVDEGVRNGSESESASARAGTVDFRLTPRWCLIIMSVRSQAGEWNVDKRYLRFLLRFLITFAT